MLHTAYWFVYPVCSRDAPSQLTSVLIQHSGFAYQSINRHRSITIVSLMSCKPHHVEEFRAKTPNETPIKPGSYKVPLFSDPTVTPELVLTNSQLAFPFPLPKQRLSAGAGPRALIQQQHRLLDPKLTAGGLEVK